MTRYLCLLACIVFAAPLNAQTSDAIITTVAGTGVEGFSGDGGLATESKLYYPEDVYVDQQGKIYIADYVNHRIRMVDQDGIITTIVGTGEKGFSGDGGLATQAQIENPTEVCLDAAGNLLFTDSDNKRIRKVDTAGIISTIAGNGNSWGVKDNVQAIESGLNGPNGICTDNDGNVYIAERWSNRIRKVAPDGIITTIAGNGSQGFSGDSGPAIDAELNSPTGVFYTQQGELIIADSGNNRLRKVDASGIISTIAGNGEQAYSGDGSPAIQAGILRPHDVFADTQGHIFFSTTSDLVSGATSHRVRKIDLQGMITTVAGNGSSWGDYTEGEPATEASLNAPTGICLDTQGNLYIAAVKDQAIRKVTLQTPQVESGLALTLDGDLDYALISESFDISTTNQLTVEAWVKPEPTSNYQGIVSSGLEYRFMIDPSFHPFWDAGMHSDMMSDAYTFSQNQWHHAAWVIEGGIEARVYVDGHLIAEDNSAIPTTLPNISQLTLGSGETSDVYNFSGQIDEIRIWNIARTQDELQQTMNQVLLGTENGLVGYWTFDSADNLPHIANLVNGQYTTNLGGDAHLSASTAPLSGTSPQPPLIPDTDSPWEIIPTGSTDIFYGVSFPDKQHGWAVGGNGQILATTDGGASGNFQDSGISGYSIFGVYFSDTQTGWIAADRGTIKHTTDGGATWAAQQTGTSLRLYDIQFTDATTGWAVGDWRTVLHTTDGGTTWTKQTTPNFSGNHLNSIHMVDAHNGWATASTSSGYHTIIRTQDGGTSWAVLLDEAGSPITDVFFVDQNMGWYTDGVGGIHHSNDAGTTWTTQTSGVSTYLRGVYFISPQIGWVVGAEGTLLKTSDGGQNWQKVDAKVSEDLTAIWVSQDQSVGWISGANGILMAFGQPAVTPSDSTLTDIRVPEDFTTIQGAIDAATSGQTVTVAAGVYYENLSLKENVAVVGESAENTIIDGQGSDVVWGANGATISGFTLTNGGDSGVFAWSTSPTITQCIITNCEQGIATAAEPIIHSNLITQNSGWGIFVGTSSTFGKPAAPQISNNLVVGNGTDASGLTLYAAGGLIVNNTIDANGTYGINISEAETPVQLVVKNNLVTNNGWYGIKGYAFDNTEQIANYNNVWNNDWDNYSGLTVGLNDSQEDPLYTLGLQRPASKKSIRIEPESSIITTQNLKNDAREKSASRTLLKRTTYAMQNIEFNFDYNLQTSSNCIDAGDPSPTYTDLDGSRNDMGAFGGPNPFLISITVTIPATSDLPTAGTLPTGERGPIALDLNTELGDQERIQSTSLPKTGDLVKIDIVINEGGDGLNGYSLTLKFDPEKLSYTGFATTDVFSGSVAIENKEQLTEGTISLSVAFLGEVTTTKGAGTIGQATFEIIDGFDGETPILISAAQIAQNGIPTDVVIGSGGEFIVIGGNIQGPSYPTEPIARSDFSGNGTVDFGDFITFAGAFGKKSDDPAFDPRIDLNDNGVVDFPDFITFAGLFGKSVSSGKIAW